MNESAVTDHESQHRLGAWFLHYWADDLREIVKPVAKIRRTSTPDEWEPVRRMLAQLDEFCRGTGEPPHSESDPVLLPEASRCQVLAFEIADFCRRLHDEWQLLDAASRQRLRAVLSHVLHRGTHHEQAPRVVQWDEVVVAALGVVAWVTIFAIGYTVHAGPYEDVLKEPDVMGGWFSGILAFCGALSMFILSSIPTNVLLLACIAGGLGTAYRRAKGHSARDQRANRAQDYMFAVTSSFFVYVGLLAGLMTLTVADALTHETAEKHIQLAGTVSICAFLVGYDRTIVVWMLQRAAKLLISTEEPQAPIAHGPTGNGQAPSGRDGAQSSVLGTH